MRKNLLRICCVLLALVMMFALVACNDNSDNNDPVTPPDNDQPDTPPTPQPPQETEEERAERELAERYATYEPFLTAQLPAIRVTTSKENASYFTHSYSDYAYDWQYIDCKVSVDNCADEELRDQLAAQIKVRGNYTSTYDKKPFRIKLKKKSNLLGLNNGAECKSWVLLAEYKDASFMRNAVSMYLAKKILGTDGYYSSDYRYVSLYVNGNYEGIYGLAEQQQINKNRINITEANEGYQGADIGYFMEYDGYYYNEKDTEAFLMNYYGTSSVGASGITIKSDVYSVEQRDFAKQYLENVYKIMYSAVNKQMYYEFNDDYSGLVASDLTDAKQVIGKVVDVQSLVDMYILQEIACDPDAGWSSFFFDVDFSENGDKILRFQAPWDFDSAYGHKKGCVESGKGEYIRRCSNPWLTVLAETDWFQEMVRAKWREAVRFGVTDKALDYIYSVSSLYAVQFEQNYNLWHNIGVNIGDELIDKVTTFRTQKDAADYLKNWLQIRFEFLNLIWN